MEAYLPNNKKIDTMNYSIIVSGFISPRHIKSIYYTKGKIIDVVNTAHGQNTWKKAVKNPKTDCIIILTPNDLHFEMALASVKNKKQLTVIRKS